jgi:hypothetical protein
MFLSLFFRIKEKATAAKSKLEEITCSVAELNQWLNEVEKSVNNLDALPVDQLSEKHISECKVGTR